MLSQTDALNNTTTYEYNDLNRLVDVTDPEGDETSYAYDADGNKTSVMDPEGNVTSYEYNYNKQPVTVTDALGNITMYTYGNTGCQSCGGGTEKLTSVTDANNHTIQYQYDTSGRLTQMTDQLGNIETYTYDLNNNLVSMTDRKGQTTTYTYDQVNRLTRADYPDGSYTTYAYDSTGKVTSMTDSISGTITYTYSTAGSGMPVGKVINETTPQSSVSYTYDAIGRRTSMTVAGQPAVNYSYDADNRLTDIDTLINGAAANFDLSYDTLGRRTGITLPNGVTTNYAYDNANRLLNLEHLNPAQQVLESLAYIYDANGNRTSMDRLNINLPKPNAASPTSYNEANQMLQFVDNDITYDANGNMTSVTNACGTTPYTWDARNRLIGISGYKPDCSALIASFAYDALGRRIGKTVNGRTIQYLYDGKDIVQEIENSMPTVNYVRTLNIDEPLARIQSDGTVRYYQADALGSIIALTNESGAIRTQYAYDPFGNVIVSGEPSDNPFQYTGRENDGTGLYYYRARYYSPELQRFISEDPIRFKGGINFFVYAKDNPISYIDPTGTSSCIDKCDFVCGLLCEAVNYLGCFAGCKALYLDPPAGIACEILCHYFLGLPNCLLVCVPTCHKLCDKKCPDRETNGFRQ
jgi:RHS repeat-associated protein